MCLIRRWRRNLKCLKETSALSSLTEGEDEQRILLQDGWRHTKCSCIPSSVNATAPRKMSKSRAKSLILRTDVPSAMHLRGREEDDTSHIKRKSGRSMRRTEGSSQYSTTPTNLIGLTTMLLSQGIHPYETRKRYQIDYLPVRCPLDSIHPLCHQTKK